MKTTDQVYVFRAALRHNKSKWIRIEILDSQTMGLFDQYLRFEFLLDDMRLSEFSKKNYGGFGAIHPFDEGEAEDLLIKEFDIKEGESLLYTHNFLSETYINIKLNKIREVDPNKIYPDIVSRNKANYKYCVECSEGKSELEKKIADYICHDCSQEKKVTIYLCEDCSDKHEDCYIRRILY